MFNFAGNMPIRKKKKSSQHTEQNLQHTEQSLTVARKPNRIQNLSPALTGIFFTVDGSQIYFLDERKSPHFVYEVDGLIRNFCACYNRDSAYFLSEDRTKIYVIEIVDGKFTISRVDAGGPVSSLICHSQGGAFYSVGKKIWELGPRNTKTLYFTHTALIGHMASEKLTLYFYSESKFYLIHRYGQAQRIKYLSHDNIENFVAFPNEHLGFTIGSDFFYVYFGRGVGNPGVFRGGSRIEQVAFGDVSTLRPRDVPPLFLRMEESGVYDFSKRKYLILSDLLKKQTITDLGVLNENLIYIVTEEEGLFRCEMFEPPGYYDHYQSMIPLPYNEIAERNARRNARQASSPRILQLRGQTLFPADILNLIGIMLYQLYLPRIQVRLAFEG